MTFASLPASLPVSGGTYRYFPQNNILIGVGGKVFIGEEIDLSAEAQIGGVDTVFTWYNQFQEEITLTSAINGVFTFGQSFMGQTVYCRMTDTRFPNLTLETSETYAICLDEIRKRAAEADNRIKYKKVCGIIT